MDLAVAQCLKVFPLIEHSSHGRWTISATTQLNCEVTSSLACTASPRSLLFSRISSVTHVLYFGCETSRTFRNNFFSTKMENISGNVFFLKYLRNILVSFKQFKQSIFYAKKIFWLCRKRSHWGNNSAVQLWEPCSSALVVILDLNV